MIIQNAKLFLDGSFHEGNIEFRRTIERISPVRSEEGALDAGGAYLIPGLIDIHTHAAVGEDASDANADGILKMGPYYAAEGVTSFCPTTMTLPEDALTEAVRAIASYQRPKNGAKIAGIHLEGPFINPSKCGAQNPDYIAAPDIRMFDRLMDASEGLVLEITVAPEMEGAMEFIKEASRSVSVSVGHTTADYETALRAFDAGANKVTHLFNAMPSLLHRAPGVIAAAYESHVFAELIPDGCHVHPSMMRLSYDLFREKLVLISDSLRCAGMPDGEYELSGQIVTMKDGLATLKGTDTIAGSSIHLMEGVRRAVSFGLPLEKMIYAATYAAAASIHKEDTIGSIEVGKCADLVLLDSDLKVLGVFIDGERI
ncbi:MAG: N-acetylglucosamine-6-phosphate deacetylase [Lachnospiraceae bacterium]|nr:N-acetylglucosamine-6-phosphate deacetylase [Lachnospiraceae bacterium]